MTRLTILFVGTTRCGNCTVFKPEWETLKECYSRGECLNLEGFDFTLTEYIVSSHDMLPSAIRNTVTFYPFVMMLPSDYLEKHINNPDDDFVLVGEAMYTYRSMKDGKLSYRLGSSVNESPDMRYPRTSEGIISWVKNTAIQSLQMLAPRYYPTIEFTDSIIDKSDRGLRMKSLFIDDEESQMDLYIPSLNKEYTVVSGGMVLCKRILNVHS
jgi:hypothetical protein